MRAQAINTAEIIGKADGATRVVPIDAIDLDVPSVVRLRIDRAQVTGVARDGGDLLIYLAGGKVVRIADYYDETGQAIGDVVLAEDDGKQWLAQLSREGARFSEVSDATELVAGAGGPGGGSLAPVLLGLLGAGGAAAAAGGGGGSDGGSGSPGPGAGPDTQAPGAPTATVSAAGTTVTGTGEAGATVQVRNAAGEVIGRGTVGANGSYSVTLDQPRTNGERLSVNQTDAAGNASPATQVSAPDSTAPGAPTLAISPDGTTVTGTGEPGATVTVRDGAGNVVGTTPVGADGNFTLSLTPPRTNGETLAAVQTDAAGNPSAAATITAPDGTAPAAPGVTLAPDGTAAVGTGEPGATVTVRDGAGNVIGSGLVRADGSFTVPLAPAQANGETVTVVQADAAGNTSPSVTIVAPDVTPPPTPTLSISADGTTVSGTGVPGSAVLITDPAGTVIGTATVNGQGGFATALTPPQIDGEAVSAVQADAAGNASAPVTVTAPDFTAPVAPVGTVSGDGTAVTGSGEPNAVVTVRAGDGTVLGTATADGSGGFTVPLNPAQTNGQAVAVVQADAAGNVSPTLALTAPDITLPDAPVATIDATGTVVSGTGEPNAAITVRGGDGAVLATGVANGAGAFSIVLPAAQIDSQALAVTQTDAASNVSPPATLTAPDLTVPAAPVATVAADGASVTGTGEAGATVIVTDPLGVEIGRGAVQSDGSYTIAISPAQTNGELLQVTQSDTAGNVSPGTEATAPDLVAGDSPDAPTATVAADGLTVTGTADAGALVSVAGPNGAPLGSAIAGLDGSYTVTLTAPQRNGEVLRVIQTDAEGDRSPPATAIAPDLTAPAAPTATLDAAGATVSGTGEPGASIRITDPTGAVIGTATVDARGNYVSVLSPAQTNGEMLGVVQTDAANNVSPAIVLTAPDFTAPPAPTATVAADGASVSGTGEAGATIIVSAPDGTVLGAATVGADGSYTAPLSPPQIDQQTLSVSQSDAAGNQSPEIELTAPDLTAPAAPTVAVTADGAAASGIGEPGATVRITDPAGTVLGTAVVAANGTYVAPLTPPQVNGQLLAATQTDAAGNASASATATAPDLIAPVAPEIAVSADGTLATGTGEPGATVVVTNQAGDVIGTGSVAAGGSFEVALSPPQANGQLLTAVQRDPTGNTSPSVTVAAPDITAPAAPAATVAADGATVTGTGEPGTTVAVTTATGAPLGTATVAADGSFTVPLAPVQANGELVRVTLTDAAGNASPATPVRAPDITAPGAPAASVSPDGAQVTGTGEPGTTVTVTGAGGILGTGVVNANGGYIVPLTPPQTDGESLSVTQRDVAGNVSVPTTAVAPDGTAPLVPTATVTPDGLAVTGTGVAGSTIRVTAPDGATIGTATVQGDGSYTVQLTLPQRNGELLGVTQADGSGNVSPRVPALAPDLTAPAAPGLAVAGDGATVTGTGEAGATVTIRNGAGTVVGTATVAADGTYAAALTPAQANGGTLTATQADGAGNISPPTTAAAPDITAPLAPANLAISPDGAAVTGTGEPGANVVVRNPAGTVIGNGTVASDGNFSIGLTTPQVTGATLSVQQSDAAGNLSPLAPLVAPFDIDAFDNSDTVSVDLLPVTSDVDFGSANYVALVSLGLLNLQANVLGTPAVSFTVQPGHSLDATFTYDALLSIGALSGYSVVVQRFDGTRWVAVDGNGAASLLELGLLNGDLVATGSFGPGAYRAFLTFQGVAGVGLLGSLSVEGTEFDYTDVGGIVPGVATGNVVTDPGPGGAVDIVSPQTVVTSVTVNGVTTAIVADGTVVDGAFGTLTINRDGSYSYTPDASSAVIGQTEQITYTLLDPSDGETESATLSIAISSGDVTAAPVAVGDSDVATVTYRNVETTVAPALEFSFNTPGAVVLPVTRAGSDSFTVAPNTVSDVTITAVRTGLVSVLPTYTITVTDASSGAVVRTVTQPALVGLPLGSGLAITLTDLPAGTYNFSVSSTNVLGTDYNTSVYVGQTITQLNNFTVATTGAAEGSLLANDAAGTAFVTVRVSNGGGFVEVGDAGLTIAGRYGTLTIDEVGNYIYRPSTTLGYSATDLIDSFTYQIVQPNGAAATATLDVRIDVPADGLAAQASGGDVILLDALTAGLGDVELLTAQQSGEPPSLPLLDETGELDVILTAYLGQHDADGTPFEAIGAAPARTIDLAPDPVSSEPLSYLVLPEDLDRHGPQDVLQY